MRLIKLILMLASLTMVTGCAQSTLSTVRSACGVFKPIHPDRQKDTAQTLVQVDEHNARGIAACHWKP